jgi:hypothetical protein
VRLRLISPPPPETISRLLATILASGLRTWINFQKNGQRARGGSKITLAEFREESTPFALARRRAEINEPTFRSGRTSCPRSAGSRPTDVGDCGHRLIETDRAFFREGGRSGSRQAAGPRYGAFDGDGSKLGRGHVLQRSAKSADCRAYRLLMTIVCLAFMERPPVEIRGLPDLDLFEIAK